MLAVSDATDAVHKARARYAGLARSRASGDPELIAAKAALVAARKALESAQLNEYVDRVVAMAPPLKPAQRDIIAANIRAHRAEQAVAQ